MAETSVKAEERLRTVSPPKAETDIAFKRVQVPLRPAVEDLPGIAERDQV
jgi:hypothetical protein